jgi:hypothetical protein
MLESKFATLGIVVTLNLFQGPFLHPHRRPNFAANRAVALSRGEGAGGPMDAETSSA